LSDQEDVVKPWFLSKELLYGQDAGTVPSRFTTHSREPEEEGISMPWERTTTSFVSVVITTHTLTVETHTRVDYS
jgi:hypothetical protein